MVFTLLDLVRIGDIIVALCVAHADETKQAEN
jgi:hypothetical protein